MIITLCGSARFEGMFKLLNRELSLLGHVVFGLSSYPSENSGKDWYTEEQKAVLDQVHKAKIAASDAILVINRFAYIGPSTLSEIECAMGAGKKIFVLESWGRGLGCSEETHTPEFVEAAKSFGLELPTRSPIPTCAFQMFWDSDLLGPAGPERSRFAEVYEEEGRRVRPRFKYGPGGCLVSDVPVPGITHELEDPDTAKFYTAPHFVAESMSETTARNLANRLGGTLS